MRIGVEFVARHNPSRARKEAGSQISFGPNRR
jgi:hypothetical protein